MNRPLLSHTPFSPISRTLFFATAFAGTLLLGACGSSDSETPDEGCEVGDQIACTCDDGSAGMAVCTAGNFGDCACEGDAGTDAQEDPSVDAPVDSSIDTRVDAVSDPVTDVADACGVRFYADADGDGYGNPDDVVADCVAPVGFVDNSDDCDDSDPLLNPDGLEICNGFDDDCDDLIDEGTEPGTYYLDGDGDGYGLTDEELVVCGQPDGYAEDADDCDDADGAVNPGADDVCDGVDNDCDGNTDEDLPTTLYYQDNDGDGVGSDIELGELCAAPPLSSEETGDCDDDDDYAFPGAPEVCDGIDNDCNGSIDDGQPPHTSVFSELYIYLDESIGRDFDGDGTIDNQFGLLMDTLGDFGSININDEIAGLIASGEILLGAAAFGVDDTRNDDSVSLWIMELEDQGGQLSPAATSFDDLGRAVSSFDRGYLADGALDTEESVFLLRIPFFGFNLLTRLRQSTIEATPTFDGLQFSFDDGLVTGAMLVDDLLGGLNTLVDTACGCLNLDGPLIDLDSRTCQSAPGTCNDDYCDSIGDFCGFIISIISSNTDIDTDGDGDEDALSTSLRIQGEGALISGLSCR